MNRRLAIFDLAHRHGLEPERVRDLQALQERASDPRAEARALARGVAIAAAALIGLGIILWIAANWPALGRVAKFALLQSGS